MSDAKYIGMDVHQATGGSTYKASAEFSFFYTKRSSFDLYIQTYRELSLVTHSLGWRHLPY